jgi:hypothetical protein
LQLNISDQKAKEKNTFWCIAKKCNNKKQSAMFTIFCALFFENCARVKVMLLSKIARASDAKEKTKSATEIEIWRQT